MTNCASEVTLFSFRGWQNTFLPVMRDKTNYSNPRGFSHNKKQYDSRIMARHVYIPAALPFSPCLFCRFACMMNFLVLYSNCRLISTLREIRVRDECKTVNFLLPAILVSIYFPNNAQLLVFFMIAFYG